MDLVYEEEAADGSLKAQAHVWNQMYNFINSAALRSAVEMGIPDIIHKHGKPTMTLSDLLAASLHVHPAKVTHLHRLMRTLINSGFFVAQKPEEEREETSSYALAPPAYYLLEDHTCSLKPYLLAMLNPVLIKPWGQLSSWLKSAWEAGRSDPKLNILFNEAMASDARLVAKVLLEKDKNNSRRRSVFEGVSSIVDVGGGYGIMTKAIAAEFPDMDCTNFNLPHEVAGLDGVGNLKHVPGDMFERIPPAHAILLKDEECVKILKKCKEAILKNECEGGKVIIIDMVVNDQQQLIPKGFETQLYFDMRMMCSVSEKEWAKLFEDAGFSGYKINPMLGLRSVIEVYP
uniref:Uncharacterized protein n=1 Tax=Kalanchoe fedtschenkoi TaxID=63787 RepID=A0A7N0RIC8_KALFE